MNVQPFIDHYNGQKVTVTGADFGQCTAVPHAWEQGLGLPIVYGNAKDTYANAPSDSYDRVANTETNFPPVGAVLVFGDTWGGGYGHTCVVLRADPETFDGFEQNNPAGSGAHVVAHPNYSGVIGWFVPKVAATPQPVTKQGAQDVVDQQTLTDIYRGFLGRDPDAGASVYLGQPTNTVVDIIANCGERAQYLANLAGTASKAAVTDQATAKMEDLDSQLEKLSAQAMALQATIADQTGQITDLDSRLAHVADAVLPATASTDDGSIALADFSKYSKAVVPIVIGAFTIAVSAFGANNKYIEAAGTLLTALGVYAVPNKKEGEVL